MQKQTGSGWAFGEFGHAQLGDVRRTRRLVQMADGVARSPSGRVSQVFSETREREGAYDLLENEHVRCEDVACAMYQATAERVQEAKFVYVAIDGSSLNLTDTEETKGFGRVGSDERGARGLKVMNAVVITKDGVPEGLIDQQYWARPKARKRTPKGKRLGNRARAFAEKETVRFVDAAKAAIERLKNVRAWVVIDRESDNYDILFGLYALRCHFTLRGNWDRLVAETEDPKARVRPVLLQSPILGSYQVEIGRTGQRAARTATMNVRAMPVELRLRNKHGKGREKRLILTAVWATETEASVLNDEPLEWLLYTNVSVQNAEEAQAVIQSYACRWRVEEFHRTWKSGTCQVEDMQLRSFEAATVWATILAANAMRVERLKYLSRTHPHADATSVMRPIELEVLLRLREQDNKPTPSGPITIELATHWIAELGGWIQANGANGPPGAITLSRGLLRLTQFTKGFELARALQAK